MFELFENDGSDDVLGLCPCPCICEPLTRQGLKWAIKFTAKALVPDNENHK